MDLALIEYAMKIAALTGRPVVYIYGPDFTTKKAREDGYQIDTDVYKKFERKPESIDQAENGACA